MIHKFIIIFFISLLPAFCLASTLPFHENEKLTFQIRWSFIPAGEVTLEVLPQSAPENLQSHHFVLTAKTYGVVDLLYKLRERIDSYVDSTVSRSVLYKKYQTGKRKYDIEVIFDWQNNQAQYSNFGETIEPITLLPGTLDPLSALYHLRMMDFSQDRPPLQRYVTDGKKTVLGQAHIIKRENITVGGTTYDTYLIEPDMKDVKGVFEKSKNAKMYIWLTADERRMLVRLKSKVVVGSFIADLIEHNYPTSNEM